MVEKKIVIAPVGENIDALFVGLREFPTQKVILIASHDKMDAAKKAKNDLEKFKIPVQIVEIKGNIWEETFQKVAEIKKAEGEKNVIINVATGDTMARCAVTSAAFVNGLQAFSVDNSEVMLLPILKFSYYNELTDKKLGILKLIYKDKTCCASLEDLSKKLKMSLPLVSYHVNGNLKSPGLKELGLIETKEEGGKIRVTLTMQGRLLIKGYV